MKSHLIYLMTQINNMKNIFTAILILTSFGAFAQSVQDTIHLNAIAADPDGTIASYQWSQVSGPACTITGANSPTVIVSFTASGHYIFQCTVADNKGKAITAQSTGDVLPANIAPTLKIVPGTFNIQLSK